MWLLFLKQKTVHVTPLTQSSCAIKTGWTEIKIKHPHGKHLGQSTSAHNVSWRPQEGYFWKMASFHIRGGRSESVLQRTPNGRPCRCGVETPDK